MNKLQYMRIVVGKLAVIVPYNCIFRQQLEYLEDLNQQLHKQESFAVEIPQSESKITILLCFFLAYLGSQYSSIKRIIYLPKTYSQKKNYFQLSQKLLKLREKQEPSLYKYVSITNNLNIDSKMQGQPTLQITTQQEFLIYVRNHQDPINGKVIIYFSQVSTLDIDCENSLSFQINETTIRKAAIEKRYLEKMINQPSSEIQYQYRQIVENIKQSNQNEFMNHNTLFVNSIQYIIGFLKTRQRALQTQKQKKSSSKKLPQILAEWVKQLNLSVQVLKLMQGRFFSLLKELKIDPKKVQSIQTILTFIKNLIQLSQRFDQKQYPNSFKCFINLKNDNFEIFSFKICCFQPRLIFDKLYRFPNREKQNKIVLVLSSSTPIHKDFFLNNFHLSFDPRIYNCKEISEKNILAMMISSNAFVDLISDDYTSDTQLQVQRSYGTLIAQFADIITDGIVVYVSSKKYLSTLMDQWKSQKIIDTLKTKKYVFVESQKEEQNKLNIRYYKQACDVGKGGIFFFTCRSKPAEIQQLRGHYSNLILFLGYPKINESELRNKQKLEYLKQKNYFKDEFLYLEQDAMRHVNKCLTSGITHNVNEKKIILFIDARFNSRLLPSWISIDQGNLNITESIQKTLKFNRYNSKKQMGKVIKQYILPQ